MSVLKVKNGNQWDIVPAIKGDTGDPAADESITDDMLVPDGIKTEIDWLWGNQLMDIREGELLQTDDAYEAPLVSLDVDGKSTQVVTTGAQMLNDATSTRGYRTNQNGNPIAASSYSMSDYIPVDANTAYYFVDMVGSQNGYTLCEYDSEKAFIRNQTIYGTTKAVGTRTTSETTAYIIVSYATTNAGTAMVSKGSTATPYEPYTGGAPAPSPDWPQDIVSVDEPTLAFVGKNMLPTLEEATTVNGVTFTPNSDGSVTITGTATANAIVILTTDGRIDNTGTLFTDRLTLSGATGGSSSTYCLRTRFYGPPVGGSVQHTGYITSSATLTRSGASWNYVEVSLYVASGATVNATVYPQLELGDTATDYEPYAGNTVSLLQDGYSLRSLPNGTKDELHLSYLRPSTREGWAWYDRELVQRISTVDLGTLDWSIQAAANGVYYALLPEASTIGSCLCSCYQWQLSTTSSNLQDGHACRQSAYNRVLVKDTAHADMTKADYTALVSGQTFDYLLATPITTQLDPIELPIMPSKDTTIWSDPSAQLKVTYIQDTNLVIESLEATVADMATS